MTAGHFHRTFGAVLRYELRIGLRSRTWWLLVLNFALPAFLVSASPAEPWVSFTIRIFRPMGTALLFLFVAPFLLLSILDRERAYSAYEIFWVHLPHTGGAFLAKALAGVLLVFLAAAPVLVWIFGVALFYHEGDGFWAWWQTLFLFLPTLFIHLALSLVCVLLFSHRFGTRALCLLLVLGLIFTADFYSLLALWGPLPAPYLNPITGFHPFSRVLLWHRVFWSLVSLGVVVWGLAQLSCQAIRPSAVGEYTWIRNMQYVGSLLILLALVPAFLYTREKTQRFYEASKGVSPHFQADTELCPREYEVMVTFDLERVHVQGEATWRGAATRPALQAGLVGSPLREGEYWRMKYRGHPRWPRQVIWCPECLRNTDMLYQLRFSPYPLGWYFVENHLFLLTTGAWHPFPGCPMETLQIRLRHVPCRDCVAVAGNPRYQRDGGTRDLNIIWEAPPVHGPLLAEMANYRVLEQGQRRFFFPRHMFPRQVQAELVAPFWKVLDSMEQVGLLAEGQTSTLAVVDQLKYPRWGQDGLVLLPAEVLDVEPGVSALSYHQYVALSLLVGWWCQSAESCVVQLAETWSAQEILTPASLPEGAPIDDPDQLAQWLQAHEQRVSSEVPMLANLLLYAAYRIQEPSGSYQPQPVDFSGILTTPLLLQRSFPVLEQLDSIYRQDPAQFWPMLRAYRERYGVQDVSFEVFTHWLQEEQGISLPVAEPTPQK